MRVPYTPTRDGNLHVHRESRYVDGTYHDGWHPVSRSHARITSEGRELHTTHLKELTEEKTGKEIAIEAKFPDKCSRCQAEISPGEQVWWTQMSPAIRPVIRHRNTECDVKESPEDTLTQYTTVTMIPETKASKEDLARFVREMAEMRKQVEAAEQKATIARKASEAAQEETRRAIDKIDKARRVEIEVTRTLPSGKKKTRTLKAKQHENFPKLLKRIAAGINVVMVGDAGSGKTVAPSTVAKILGRDFYHIPLGPQTSKSDLLGYMNGAGKYVYSLLCQVYEHGGIALLDEMDAANPATLTIINGMLEAVEAGFADKMRKRHPDCAFVAAMNTYGRGADMLFVGRAQLDAATLNRWYYLEWNTDWDLARGIVKNDKWVNYIEALYNSAARQRVRVTIGMRTAIMGQKAMDDGDTQEEAEHGLIWAPIRSDDKQKILAGISQNETSP